MGGGIATHDRAFAGAAPSEHDAVGEASTVQATQAKGVVEVLEDGGPADEGAVAIGELIAEHGVGACLDFRAEQRVLQELAF